LSETLFIGKLAQINCFLSGVGEGYNFALGGSECDKGGASGYPAHSAVVDDENVAHARKWIRFDIGKAGISVAIDVAR
jgi:hypothetical protein